MPKTIYKEVKTVGQIEWPRLNEENRDLTGYGGAYEKSEGAYTVNQILDKEGMKSQTQIPQAGGAPKVTDKDDNTWTEDMGVIGNGTLAECTNLITTFTGSDGQQYSRTSLVGVKVLELEEYVKENEAVGF